MPKYTVTLNNASFTYTCLCYIRSVFADNTNVSNYRLTINQLHQFRDWAVNL